MKKQGRRVLAFLKACMEEVTETVIAEMISGMLAFLAKIATRLALHA